MPSCFFQTNQYQAPVATTRRPRPTTAESTLPEGGNGLI